MNFSNHPYLCKGLYKAKNYLARRPLFKIKEHTIILKIGMPPNKLNTKFHLLFFHINREK
ncbi:hypothetical protein THERMOT_1205 [Bathymodiolus thermophilus thioautotrophic gill symbiont]|nr:hypothetical protein THERMOT_1205 [Bathymodiolus thermophilus thioautotrophic gill symbiont]